MDARAFAPDGHKVPGRIGGEIGLASLGARGYDEFTRQWSAVCGENAAANGSDPRIHAMQPGSNEIAVGCHAHAGIGLRACRVHVQGDLRAHGYAGRVDEPGKNVRGISGKASLPHHDASSVRCHGHRRVCADRIAMHRQARKRQAFRRGNRKAGKEYEEDSEEGAAGNCGTQGRDQAHLSRAGNVISSGFQGLLLPVDL